MFSRFAAGLLPTAISLAVLVPVASAADAPPPPSGPVVDRTTFTTTTREEGGVYRTRAFPEPVNFKADGQEWRAIDRTLEREADGTVRPVAVDGDAAIPRTLDEPLLLEHDGRRLTFRLMGVDDDIRETSGSKAEFDAAIPDVDVTYRARAFGLKETIVLQSKAARRSFSYDLRADDDLTGEIDHRGDLIFTDGSGNEQFRVSAPLAWDSGSPKSFSNALDLDVTKKSAGRWVLTMRADDEWLDDPSRVYPVSLDPDFYWVGAAMRFHGAQQDCYLAGGSQAGTSFCAANIMQVGYYNRPYKALMRFDLAQAIPQNSAAFKATFLAWQPPSTPKAPGDSRLRTVTSEWTNQATWDVRKTGIRWPTTGGGGDVSSERRWRT